MHINIDGYDIHYRITGEGDKTLVILQGWGTDLSVYDSVAACVNDRYRVVQFDFPGFGDSDEPKEAWAVADYADFFVKFMDAIGVKSASLLGHSYGGRVITRLAGDPKYGIAAGATTGREPAFEIEKIILLDAAGVMPERTPAQKRRVRRYKILKHCIDNPIGRILCPQFIEEWREHQGSEDYRNATPIMRQCLVKAVNEDLTHLMPAIQQETLLIWGDLDTATPISDAHKMEQLIPNSGLAVIQGTGHFSFLEQPELFCRIMNAFL